MTNIDKLLEEHPLPWSARPWAIDGVCIVDRDGGHVPLDPNTWDDANTIIALANALHAERQKRNPVIRTADEVDQIAQMKRNIVSHANRIGRAFELIGKVEARLDAIANAARGDES